MSRVYNFSAGPAILPDTVLKQAQDELIDWHNKGLSVMEMSHRSDAFQLIASEAEDDLRDLLQIPKNYKVIFLQGGASSQFAMVPMNLLGNKNSADYINTGAWSQKAINEAKHFCNIHLAGNIKQKQFIKVPDQDELEFSVNAAYLHYTPNETISGIKFPYVPKGESNIPLVADMSSTILSHPININQYGVIYASSQKNIGPAGLTLVIIRNDLLEIGTIDKTPTMLRYITHTDKNSMYNTPPVYSWYIAGLVFKWLKKLGGLDEIAKTNEHKAKLLYDVIDNSHFYVNSVDPEYRSWMNVTFNLSQPNLEAIFLKEAESAGLLALRGHRSIGGVRASIYNAMPTSGVEALVNFMTRFEYRNS